MYISELCLQTTAKQIYKPAYMPIQKRQALSLAHTHTHTHTHTEGQASTHFMLSRQIKSGSHGLGSGFSRRSMLWKTEGCLNPFHPQRVTQRSLASVLHPGHTIGHTRLLTKVGRELLVEIRVGHKMRWFHRKQTNTNLTNLFFCTSCTVKTLQILYVA